MKNNKRAIRRHHRERLRRKRRGYHGNDTWKENDPVYVEETASFYVNTPCPCSCDMCCNPRHSIFYKGVSKLTIQERKELCKNKIDMQEITTDKIE